MNKSKTTMTSSKSIVISFDDNIKQQAKDDPFGMFDEAEPKPRNCTKDQQTSSLI